VHKHGSSNDKLCKRYLFNLEVIAKDKAAPNKKIEGPPLMLYLRELYASIHQIFKEQVLAVVRSSPDGCPPHCRAAAKTNPHPPDARALLPTHLLPGATHHHGRRTTHTLACRPARSPLHSSLPPTHMHRAPARLRGHHTKCTGTAPELLTHIRMRTNASPPSTGLTILGRRDLKRCWLATNAC
jgi:hypothetical protein